MLLKQAFNSTTDTIYFFIVSYFNGSNSIYIVTRHNMHLPLVIPILFHDSLFPSSYLTYYSRRSSPSLLSSSPAHFFRSSSQVMSCSSSLSSLYPTFCSSHHFTSSSSSISSFSPSFLLQYVLTGFFLPLSSGSHRSHFSGGVRVWRLMGEINWRESGAYLYSLALVGHEPNWARPVMYDAMSRLIVLERAKVSLSIFIVRHSSFSHRLHHLSLLFLKEYVGMAAEVEGLESTVVGGDSSTKKRSLP